MSTRTRLCLLVLATAGWWWSPLSPRARPAPSSPDEAAREICRAAPHAGDRGEPLQTRVPPGIHGFRLAGARVTPLAGFSVDARVLGREDYRLGREARFSPTDLALGWARMRDDQVVARLDIRQSGRWFNYRWEGEPPLPPAEIVRSSANMHIIPADAAAAAALRRVRAGQRVRLEGWLVRLDADDGWHWQSSLSRDDSGSGACELVYACSIASE